jgi:hypothetical protein
VGSITVVIATLDDRQTLRDCLDGVLAGNPSVTEVLVVDRGSVDGTSDIVRGAGPPVRLLECPGSHRTDAMAAGAAEAEGDVVAFVPSRAVLRAGMVEEAVRGQSTTVTLRPVGATAFGRAAAAVVGSGVFRVETRPRPRPGPTSTSATAEPSAARPRRPSSYVVADSPVRLAGEAFRSRSDRRSAAGAVLIVAAAGPALFGRGWPRAAVPAGHAAVCAVRAVRAGRDAGVAPHRAFLAAEVWDWSAGTGWLSRAIGRRGRRR